MIHPFDLRNRSAVVSLLATGEEAAAMQHRMLKPQMDQLRYEFEQVLLILVQIPVRPGDRIVLAVGVVVALLGARHFVAAADHRNALAEQQRGEHVAHLLLTKLVNILDGRRTFDTAVPRTIVAFTVPVALAVGLIMLLVVAHQIVHGEAVVRGDEVHGCDRSAAIDLIQVGTAHESAGEFRQRGRLRAPEVAHAIAVAAVPFGPAGREAAHLIAARAEIPRFRDQLDAGDHRILFDDVEEGRQFVDFLELTGQCGGKIESESVDVHFGDPVAQAVGDELQGVRRAHQQRVAGACGVEVVSAVVVDQTVVGAVVDALEAEGRSTVVAFGGVVVHHVEDDFHAGMMVCLDHGFEFVDLFAALSGAGIRVVRGEEADGVVSPVVAQAFFLKEAVIDELVDGHELDGRDAQLLQVFDYRGVRQTRIGSANVRRHVHVEVGHAAYVGFVNHGIVI